MAHARTIFQHYCAKNTLQYRNSRRYAETRGAHTIDRQQAVIKSVVFKLWRAALVFFSISRAFSKQCQ